MMLMTPHILLVIFFIQQTFNVCFVVKIFNYLEVNTALGYVSI